MADEDNNGYIDATELRKFFEFFYGQPIPGNDLVFTNLTNYRWRVERNYGRIW